MPQTRAEIWGTLKRYLIYTAAGFVVLGGVGALEASRPPLVGAANASQPGQAGQPLSGRSLRGSVSPEALLAAIRADAPSWTQRLHFDTGSESASASGSSAASGQLAATSQPAPYYPAPDTAEPQASVDAAATPDGATPLAAPSDPATAAPAPVLMASAAQSPAPLPPPGALSTEPAGSSVPATPPSTATPSKASATAPSAPAPAVQPPAPAMNGGETADDRPALPSLVATLNWVYGDTGATDDSDAAAPDAASAEATTGDSTDTATADTPAPDAGTSDAGTSDSGTPDAVAGASTDASGGDPSPAADPAAIAASTAPLATDVAGEQRVIEVHRGDTLFGLLTRAGLTDAEAEAASHSLSDVFSPSELKVGQQITLNLETDAGADASSGKLLGLSLQPSAERDVKLVRASDGEFVSASIDKPLTERVDRAAGQIDLSLFESARDAGVPVSMIGDIIKAYSYDVDFQRDIHEGDSFEVLFERYDNADGDLAKAGRMLYASLTLGGKAMPIYYFERDGDGEYYTADGVAVRKSLLKTPIDGARITSSYGMRVNPILGYSMMHQGVDFGAPIGTPIFAAGNGVIEKMGWVNGYGNYMKLRHNGTYETAYAHISKFVSGLKRGSKVKQGQVIAYVGATGRATGPHLHFEVLIGGKHVNPSTVKTVAADKLKGKELAAFKAEVASIDGQRRAIAARSQIADQSGAGAADLDCRGPRGCQN